jgi:hypothetical protein
LLAEDEDEGSLRAVGVEGGEEGRETVAGEGEGVTAGAGVGAGMVEVCAVVGGVVETGAGGAGGGAGGEECKKEKSRYLKVSRLTGVVRRSRC